MTSARPQAGFTLIEILISMSLMAFMAVSVVLVMRNSSEIQEDIRARGDLSQMGRNAMEIMRRELSLAYISQNQSDYYKTVFKATDRDPIDEVWFTSRSHEKRYAMRKESDLAEVSYFSEPESDGRPKLLHRESPIIDDDPERGGTVLGLAHGVHRLNFRYFDKRKEEWLDEWDSEDSEFMNRVPDAVEIRLELEDSLGHSEAFVTRTLVKPNAQ